jgi:hypothetical protein
MNAEEKNNRQASELTRLKLLWQKWPDAERQKVLGWREEEVSPGKLVTNAIIRGRIKKYYKVDLIRDGQLSDFWSWSTAFMESLAMQEFMATREQSLIDQNPEISRDAIRDSLIKEWYAWAKAKRDPELGLEVVKMDLKDREQTFEEAKFKESLKSKLQAGLDAVAEAFKSNPEAMQFYTRARSMIEREMK